MHVTGHTPLPIEITGPSSKIDTLAAHHAMRGARRCDLHGRAWLELADATPAQLDLAGKNGCQVHGLDLTSPPSTPSTKGSR